MKTLWMAIAASTLVAALAIADEPAKEDGAPKLQAAQCGDIPNLHAFGSIYLAGQPDAEDLKAARQQGIKAVINLRDESELDYDEKAAVERLGMKYHHLPVASADALTDAVFDKGRALLKSKDNHPLLLHCASANRVGALWLAHRVLDGGLPYEEALEEAKTVGLRSPALEQKAKQYIERQ